jgi:hypothetical protein
VISSVIRAVSSSAALPSDRMEQLSCLSWGKEGVGEAADSSRQLDLRAGRTHWPTMPRDVPSVSQVPHELYFLVMEYPAAFIVTVT